MTTTERSSVMIPADWVPAPKQGQWTYQYYAAIPEDGHRYEVVRGVLLACLATTLCFPPLWCLICLSELNSFLDDGQDELCVLH
jgi:hypothetical protein